jgi:hypothetical protein
MTRKIFIAITVFTLLLISITSKAQKADSTSQLQLLPKQKKKERSREFYFSWGYNSETYTRSNITINQPSLGNNFVFESINAHDHKGWDEGIFHLALSIPQYNYRLGLIINKEKDWGVEINFDHTKYIFADQHAHLVGTLDHRQVDTLINFNLNNGFYYYLNNGANFLLFNFVKRWHWIADKSGNLKVDVLGKAGIGPVIPHVQNAFFSNDSTSTEFRQQGNDPHFQLGGWNIGVEGALRVTFFKYAYLEYCNKLDYARYSNLKIYDNPPTNIGTAKQAFGTYEEILNLGVTFPVGKR